MLQLVSAETESDRDNQSQEKPIKRGRDKKERENYQNLSGLGKKELMRFCRKRSADIDTESRYVTSLYWELGEALIRLRTDHDIPHGEWTKVLNQCHVHESKWRKAKAIRESFSSPDECDNLAINKAYDLRKRKNPNRKHPTKTKAPAPAIPPVDGGQVVEPILGIRIAHCDFRDIERLAGIEPGTVDLVATDPVYDKEWLPNVEALAATSARILKDSGVFACYFGKYYLPDAIELIRKHLTYRWHMCIYWPESNGQLVRGLDFIEFWTPIIVATKGSWTGRGLVRDLILSKKEKSLHPWQKPVGDFEQLITSLSPQGGLVVDLCSGSFSSAVAAHRTGRRYVGCDVDKECFDLGLARIDEIKAEMVNDVIDLPPEKETELAV